MPIPQRKSIFELETPKIEKFPVTAKERLDFRYPLIPPYAYAHIHWDKNNKELIYEVEEPRLTPEEKKVLTLLEDGIKELINISYISVEKGETLIEYLEKNIKVLLDELRIEITDSSYLKIMYYVYRDFIGLGKIEPLLTDYFIEDIECNGSNFPLYIVHRKYRNMRTNIIYESDDELRNFVEKLAQKCGQYISYATPLLDGALPDNSRVNATFTQDISSRGPTFSIRKFTKKPWTPTQLMYLGTVSPQMLAYLWLLVEYEKNIMIVGGTASGKTTLLNCLTFFIPPQARVISIEDTRELNLYHTNWLPAVARAGVGLTNLLGQKYGEVTLFDLLKESFRQNPDYVIVGEIRGQEAYVLFQGMASIKGDEEILILKNGELLQEKIKEVKDIKNCFAVTYDLNKKEVKLLPIKAIIKHPTRRLLYKITTKTGREIVLTPDHSLFRFDNEVISTPMENLRIGDNILIPSKIPCGLANLEYINLLEFLPNARVYAPDLIKEAVTKTGYYLASHYCNVAPISDYYSDFKRSRPSSLKVNKFIDLMKKAGIDYNSRELLIKFDKKSKSLPSKLPLTKEFLKLLGYYSSEGSISTGYKMSNIALYNKNEKILKDMEQCIEKITGERAKKRLINRGFGSATELSFSHKVIHEFLKQHCGTKQDKKIPNFIFGLSKERIGQFLSALYDGDGTFTDSYIGYYTISRKFADTLSKLLLTLGIVATIRKRNRTGRKTTEYEILLYNAIDKNKFLRYVQPIKGNIKAFLGKTNNCKVIGDLYIDKIKSIEQVKLDKNEPVYDIVVHGTRNFVGGFGGGLLHNSGHPSFGTMHANSVDTMIRRLETPPINLSASLVESLDAVCVMATTKVAGKSVRRVREVVEIVKVDEKTNQATIVRPFIWDPRTDTFEFKTGSKVFQDLIVEQGISEQYLLKELDLRTKLLTKIYQMRIFTPEQIRAVINDYYKDPRYVLSRFGLI